MRLNNITPDKIALLLESIFENYGYDFRQYAESHVYRRVLNRLSLSGIGSIDQLTDQIIKDKGFASMLIEDLSITVTEMFRDSDFYIALREKVIPILKTYPFIKIWHAGCSTGQEAYSMAIVLKEEGLYERSTIYATDFNQKALNHAKEGIYPNKLIRDYTYNYQKSGGKHSLSNYFTSDSDRAIMNQSIKKNIVWANHNLVTDSVFSEVHLILCRNVLIYFNSNLQNKVHHLFFNSLIKGGLLCLGLKESLRFNDFSQHYVTLFEKQRIFKKKYEESID